MKRLLIFLVTGLLLIAAVGIAGCTSDTKTPAAPVSTPEPTPEPVSLNVQASWINNNLRVQGTADLPDGEVVTVEVYDTYVSKNIPDEPIPMSDGSILTYTSEGIFHTMDVTVSRGEYVAVFEGIGKDILKGESLRVRTLYQGSVSNEVNPVKPT